MNIKKYIKMNDIQIFWAKVISIIVIIGLLIGIWFYQNNTYTNQKILLKKAMVISYNMGAKEYKNIILNWADGNNIKIDTIAIDSIYTKEYLEFINAVIWAGE